MTAASGRFARQATTKGHLPILLRLKDGREVLVVGNAAYTLRSINEGVQPMLTADDDASKRSLRALIHAGGTQLDRTRHDAAGSRRPGLLE